jgi:hypothetical protein
MGDIPQGVQLFVPETIQTNVRVALDNEAKRLAGLGMYRQAADLHDLATELSF